MNKKRKFQDEQLGLLRPNRKSCDRTFTLGPTKSQSNTNPEAENVYTSITKKKMDGGDESDDQDSAKGSNNFQGDPDSVMCVSGEAKTKLGYQKMPTGSSSSVNCGGFSEKLGFGESDYVHRDFGLHASMNYDERVLEFELRNDGIEEEWMEKEIDDLLYSNGESGNKFVLSSGRWDVNQETQKGTKNLTIDKEFEQYFSMLML